ncbi:uncharacterized protein LOC110443368 [Mizuhopecten yessoensis]|uniref:uncharacterized protein LOC110443368 n=1 Tax=Mizuhopecten yessoensis TaxID=6573 RepID=UPI000B45BE78|nr:uncharacterized protein LOC110443368 [Mizuhopecten yessoensis]
MYDEVKNASKKQGDELQRLKRAVHTHTPIKGNFESLEKVVNELKSDKDELKRSVTDLRWRSMKNNLVFSGLLESPKENTESLLREFLHVELNIQHHIELGNVHRFGKFIRGKRRSIVARFIYNNGRSLVLKRSGMLAGTSFYINEQFPSEVEQKRRQLYPTYKDLKAKHHKVKLVRDKLIVDGKLYTGPLVSSDVRAKNSNPRQTRTYSDVAQSPSNGSPGVHAQPTKRSHLCHQVKLPLSLYRMMRRVNSLLLTFYHGMFADHLLIN